MQTWIAYALVGALGLALGVFITLQRVAQRGRVQGRARNTRGKRGEERAAQLLERAGYRIVERQRKLAYQVQTDREPLDVGVTFDFVVQHEGRELIAEVKTGTLVTQLRHADTRRQLLEYQLVSGAEHVLLVDPDQERITCVSFPLPTERREAAPAARAPQGMRRLALLWGALLLLAAALYALAHVG